MYVCYGDPMQCCLAEAPALLRWQLGLQVKLEYVMSRQEDLQEELKRLGTLPNTRSTARRRKVRKRRACRKSSREGHDQKVAMQQIALLVPGTRAPVAHYSRCESGHALQKLDLVAAQRCIIDR